MPGIPEGRKEGRKEMFYLTTHSSHFICGYMASDIWLRTTEIAREETRCRHMGYSFRLTARVLLYAPSHIQDNTYHGLCYTSRGHVVKNHSDAATTFRLAARVLFLYAPSRTQDSTYHGLGSSDRSFMVDPLSYVSF